MKRFWRVILALALLAGGAAAVLQKRGRPRKIRDFSGNGAAAVGRADGPTSVLISIGFHRPDTWLSLLRRAAAAVCRFAAAHLCGPRGTV